MSQNEYWVAFGRTFKIRTGLKGQSIRLKPEGPTVVTPAYDLEMSFKDSQPLGESTFDQFTRLTSVEEVRQWLLNLGGRETRSSIGTSQRKENDSRYWHAFGREFKVANGSKGQTIRLQPEFPTEQSVGDAFTFRFVHSQPLNESRKNQFAQLSSVEEVKKWLLSLGGKEEPFSKSASHKSKERTRRRKNLLWPLAPFLQDKNSDQCYSERFLRFRSLCNETVHRLLSMQSTAVLTPSPGTRMVFPQRRLGSVRVSEQEARFQFCIAAENRGNIAWAVEVPTTRSYRQKAKREDGLSGRTDVAIFEFADQWRRVLNIEFKAGRASVADCAKDLEQLIREQIPGAWFHLLSRPTHLDFIASNMTKGLQKAIRAPLEKQEELFQVDIDIAICVLNESTWGSGITVGADLYLKRIEYRRPNTECFDLEDFDRKIEEELKNPGQWERQHFAPAAGSIGAQRV